MMKPSPYPCTCRGCLNRTISSDIASAYRIEHIYQALAPITPYFSPDTRRFFGSRLSTWKVVAPNPREVYQVGALLAVESKRSGFDQNAPRVFRTTVFCRFGQIAGQSEDGTRRAAVAWMDTDEPLAALQACACHGCTIYGAADFKTAVTA